MTAKLDRLMSMSDCERCYASKRTGTMIDVIHPETGQTVCCGETLEQVRKEYPDAEEMSVDEFCEWKAEQQRTPIVWLPTTERQFNEMLECLYPAAMGGGGFLVGEPFDHEADTGKPRYQGFRHRGDEFYVSSRPLTRDEFRTEMQASR